MEKLLSIIIPAWNVEKFIEECILSLESQNLDYELYEIIIINDGSTDRTEEKIKDLSIRFTNIKTESTVNRGQSAARNMGLELAEGKYVWFVDADDYVAHNILRKLLSFIWEDPDLITFESRRVESSDLLICNNYYNHRTRYYDTGKQCFQTEGTYNGPTVYLIRKKLLKESNLQFVEGRYLEDGLFTCTLYSIAKKTIATGLDVYRYFDRKNSTCNSYKSSHQRKMIDDFLYAVIYLQKLLNDNQEADSQYILALQQRINSYVFFLQVRLIRFGDVTLLNKVYKQLRDYKLIPYQWEDERILLVVISKMFRIKIVSLLFCKFSGILNSLKDSNQYSS